LVGINFGVIFLRPDGARDKNTSLELLVRHTAYVADRIGVKHVALGSDFDGTTVPTDLKDASGLPVLVDALKAHGFQEDELVRITHANWIEVLERSWGQ
jgi:membrane dipeptidase